MKRLSILLLTALFCCTTSISAANYCASSAWGNGQNATGGGNATPVLVSSVSELSSALNKGKNKVIIITQSLTFTSMLSVQDGANVTLLGLPGVTLTSLEQTKSTSGILYVKRFDNLIIRNLTFVGPGAYDCDGNDLLCFEKVTNAWVDHCDFQDGCDGNFDNKSLTDNVTVSWCRFRYLKAPKAGGSGGSDDHRFTNLLGSSSSDCPSDGTYNMTWAYCWWDEGCKERMLRCRNAELHFLNCYWNSSVANYYVGPENAKAYFEGCTFEGKANSSSKIFKSYGGTNACKFVNSSGNLPSNSGTVAAPTYSYDQLSAAAAKTMVTNSSCGAGATLTVTNAGKVSSSCDGGSTPITYYTVTWNATANGGTCATATSQVASGDAVGTLPSATKSGYTFDGWFTAASGGTKITSSTVINGNITFYAQFTENSSTPTADLTWNFSTSDFNALGTITSTTTVNGLTITATSDNTVVVDGSNKTIEGISFSHRLKTGGGGASNARTLSFAVTGNCTIEIYCISSNSTDTRTLNIYTGSYGGTTAATRSVGTTASKQTYDYTGGATTIYLCSASGGMNFYAINVIYASTPEPTPTYTLSYDDNGGNGTMEEQTADEGTAVTVKANGFTAPTGYSFKEWNDNSKGDGTKYNVGQSVTMNEDLTLYAIWQANTYTVTLNAAGGTGGSTSVIATFDAAMPNITLPTRSGYNFLGYFTEQNGAGVQYYDANGSGTNSWIIASNTTLYAAWEEQSVTPVVTGDLHFWFFYEADATTNGVTNDATVFSDMVASGSAKAGSITIDGTSYSITKRTGDNQVFGSFTVPSGKEAIFYALAVSSGNGDRQINLVRGTTTYELPVAGGSDSYKRIESEILPAGTYSIERDGSSNVRLGIVVVRITDAGSTPTLTTYTVTWDATTNGGTCATASSTIEENAAVGTLPEASKDGWTFDGWFTQATGGEQVTSATVITDDVTFYAQFTENGGDISTPSHTLTWNFTDSKFDELVGDISTTVTVDGLTMVATSSGKMTMDSQAKNYIVSAGDTIKFVRRIKTGGSIKADYRHWKFDVTGKCTIEVYGMSGGSEERQLNVYTGSLVIASPIAQLPMGTTLSKQVYEYTEKNATTIYLGSANSGINLYAINVIYPSSGETPTTYTVTVAVSGDGGTASVVGEATVESGEQVTIKATAADCYEFDKWVEDSSTEATHSVTVTGDATYTATFKVLNHSVTIQSEDDAQGTVQFVTQ